MSVIQVRPHEAKFSEITRGAVGSLNVVLHMTIPPLNDPQIEKMVQALSIAKG